MGIPLSWTFLSLVHLLCCLAIGAPEGTFFLKGDDLIAYWPNWLVRRYEKFLERLSGMPLNLHKTFHCLARGVFCEKAYIIQRAVGCDVAFSESYHLTLETSFVSVRALSFGLDRWVDVKGPKLPDIDHGVPSILSAARYLTEQIPRVGHRKSYRLAATALSKWYQWARRNGRSLYLPIELGGMGLIPRSGRYRFPPVVSHALNLLAAGDPRASAALKYQGVTPRPGSAEARVKDRVDDAYPKGSIRIQLNPTSSEREMDLQLYQMALRDIFTTVAALEKLPPHKATRHRNTGTAIRKIDFRAFLQYEPGHTQLGKFPILWWHVHQLTKDAVYLLCSGNKPIPLSSRAIALREKIARQRLVKVVSQIYQGHLPPFAAPLEVPLHLRTQ